MQAIFITLKQSKKYFLLFSKENLDLFQENFLEIRK